MSCPCGKSDPSRYTHVVVGAGLHCADWCGPMAEMNERLSALSFRIDQLELSVRAPDPLYPMRDRNNLEDRVSALESKVGL